MLERYHRDLPGLIVHCFTGTKEQCRAYIERGYFISISGYILKETNNDNYHEVRACLQEGILPLDKLMIETDAPFLAPRDLEPRVSRNEPRHLPHILRAVAACRGEAAEDLAPSVLETSRAFFGLPHPTN